MKIQGIEGLTHGELRHQIEIGGRFVYYKYCVSLMVITFRRGSSVYFVRADQSRVAKGLPWTALTLVAGWWGIPWGPIFSITSIVTNFRGGVDVTEQLRSSLGLNAAAGAPPPLPPPPAPLPGQY